MALQLALELCERSVRFIWPHRNCVCARARRRFDYITFFVLFTEMLVNFLDTGTNRTRIDTEKLEKNEKRKNDETKKKNVYFCVAIFLRVRI